MSDDIYKRMKDAKDTPIYNDVVKSSEAEPVNEKKWWEKILNPTFRRWAYGVASAAVIAGAIWAGKPEFAATAAPLIMALFYVDSSGEPR